MTRLRHAVALTALMSPACLSGELIAQAPPAYVITTIAGNGAQGYSGDGGPATSAMLNQPYGVAIDHSGTVYFTEPSSNRIRKVTGSGTISTVAGNGVTGFSGDGGPATAATLNLGLVADIAVDGMGNVYIADSFNNRIRKVTPGGTINTVAGSGFVAGFGGDGGPATVALLANPVGVAVDHAGNIYIADTGNSRIRKVNTSGTISTVAGNVGSGFSGDGGTAVSASLSFPWGVAVDVFGNVYIADTANNRIRKVDTRGIIITVAGGGGDFEFEGNSATNANLVLPATITTDGSSNYYFPN